MYAYVMRPDSIPPSYNKFIVNCGPIDEVVLQAVRDNCRGRAVDAPTLRKYLVARAKKPGFLGRVFVGPAGYRLPVRRH